MARKPRPSLADVLSGKAKAVPNLEEELQAEEPELALQEAEVVSREVSREEMEVAFAGPAVQSNRFFVTIGPSGARIAFAEQFQGHLPIFRTAVNLSFHDTFSLVAVLQDLLARNVRLVPDNQDEGADG